MKLHSVRIYGVCNVSPGGHNSNEPLKGNVVLEQVTQRIWRRSKQHKLNIKKQRSEHHRQHTLSPTSKRTKKLFLVHKTRFTFIKLRCF